MKIYEFLPISDGYTTNVEETARSIIQPSDIFNVYYEPEEEILISTGNVHSVTVAAYHPRFSNKRKAGHWIGDLYGGLNVQTQDGCDVIDAQTKKYKCYPVGLKDITNLNIGESIDIGGSTLRQLERVSAEEFRVVDNGTNDDTLILADGTREILHFLYHGREAWEVPVDLRYFYVFKNGYIYKVDINNCPDYEHTDPWDRKFLWDFEIDGTVYLRPHQKANPFDDKGYTKAVFDDVITYNSIKSNGDSFTGVALGNMSAGSYTVFTNGGAIMGDVLEGATVFLPIPNGTEVSVDIRLIANDDQAYIGTIGLMGKSYDAGITRFDASSTMNDNSPHEVKKGGYVDYVPGITTFKDTVTTIIPIDDDTTIQRFRHMIKTIKRRRMAFDIGDRWHGQDDINTAMMVIARVDSVSYSLKSGRGDDMPPQYIEARWTIGEAS